MQKRKLNFHEIQKRKIVKYSGRISKNENYRISKNRKHHERLLGKICERFESDMFKAQKRIWRMIRRQKTDMNEFVKVQSITKEQLIKDKDNSTRSSKINAEVVEISKEEINVAIKHLKNNYPRCKI